MITLSGPRKLIDAADLVEILKEKQRGLVGYEHKAIDSVLEIIEAMPDLAAEVKAMETLP